MVFLSSGVAWPLYSGQANVAWFQQVDGTLPLQGKGQVVQQARVPGLTPLAATDQQQGGHMRRNEKGR